jgi:hypothetical protein
MTITVELKELRDFEANVHNWGCRRGLAAVEAMSKLYESDNFYRGGSQNVGPFVKKTLDEWDEKNPPPKLIPSV